MKVTFKEYILEYYKGRNATIGFRYSKPNLQSNIKLLVFSKSSELENIISNRLDELLDKHYLDISIISNNNVIDHILNNIPTELINIIIEKKLDLYEVSIELLHMMRMKYYHSFLSYLNLMIISYPHSYY